MFARQSAAAAETPSHVEFLIDRHGYLRVRWIGIAPAGTRRTTEVLDRIDILKREPRGRRRRGDIGTARLQACARTACYPPQVSSNTRDQGPT